MEPDPKGEQRVWGHLTKATSATHPSSHTLTLSYRETETPPPHATHTHSLDGSVLFHL